VWTAGNLRYRITKALNGGGEETGDLGRREEDLFEGIKNSALDLP
jgi:hypothetical protein